MTLVAKSGGAAVFHVSIHHQLTTRPTNNGWKNMLEYTSIWSLSRDLTDYLLRWSVGTCYDVQREQIGGGRQTAAAAAGQATDKAHKIV